MATSKIEGVYEIRIENGPALRAFEEVKRRLDNTKGSIRDLNKENKELITAERQLNEVIKASGSATSAQAKQLEAVRMRRDELNKELSEAVLVEKALSAQSRELSNDLSRLTENGLRFRDKMAQATVEALKQSGVLDQLSQREEQLNTDLKLVSASLEKNQQEMAALTLAYSAGEKTAEQYAQEQAILNQEIEAGKAANTLLKTELQQVSATTGTLETRIHELNQELNAGKINTEQYRVALSRIEDETTRAGAATGALTSKFDAFVGNQGKELKSSLTSLALNYVGVGAAINGLANIAGDAFETIKGFDKALASVSALGGTYAANIDAIAEATKTAGIQFGFTAIESVGAVEALAKAGVEVEDILGGGLQGALTLAAAGELSVGQAAESAAKAMVQFGLSGQDVTHIADLFANSANKALGEVSDITQALNQSGQVASQFGVSVEQTVGTLTAFANAGLLGSDAGTSFRTMLLRLAKPSDDASALMDKLGISAFDAEGKFVGIEDLAGQLQDRLKGLTEEQRNSALATIFGTDAIRSASILYKEGAKGVEKWTEEVSQSGEAARIAAEKTNNLAGDQDKLKASWDALVLGGGPVNELLRGITQSITTQISALADANNLWEAFVALTQPAQAPLIAAAKRAKEFQESLDPANQSLDTLRKNLALAEEQQRGFAEVGKTDVAAEFDPKIDALRRLITARESLAASQQKNVEGDTVDGASIEQTTEKTKALTAAQLERIAAEKALRDAIDAPNAGKDFLGKPQNETAVNPADNNTEVDATKESLVEIEALTEEHRINELQGVLDYNLEKEILAQQYRDGQIKSEEEYQARLALLAQEHIDDIRQKRAVEVQLAEDTGKLLGEVLTGQIGDAKEFQKAFLLILLKAAKQRIQIEVATAQAAALASPESVATSGIAGVIKGAIITGLIEAVFAGLGAAITGFASGGEYSEQSRGGGVVRPSWGTPVNLPSGDNVLVRGDRGPVALQTDEVVVSRKSRRDAERKFGPGIWAEIGVPGFSTGEVMGGFRKMAVRTAYAEGGVYGMVTPRPSPSTIVNNQLVSSLDDLARRPSVVSVGEINDVQGRVEVQESARTL